MKKIQKLPPEVIAKIAAGEVIERPSYVVKELIENAIDAKADYIKIDIDQSGLKRIVVTDNGEGMSNEDIQECIKPHTTSKILSEEDLIGIKSLGFRGEALSSIAAVSDMQIKSKTITQTAGTFLTAKAGKIIDVSPIGTAVGTTVIVDNLFNSIPARKKFLKSTRTEFRHIIDVVTHFALSFPSVRFVLTHNKKIIFDLLKNQDISERIKLLLGNYIFNNLIPISLDDSYISISGYICRPQVATYTQNKQFVFVNQRYINDKLISMAVKDAYGSLLQSDVYPVCILFITLPHQMVDVNVHPRKEQVSFVDNRMIFDTVYKAVSETLAKHNLTFFNINLKEDYGSYKKGHTKSFIGMLLKDELFTEQDRIGEILKSSDIIQIHNTYLITQTKKGVIIIDQHAAHERILYEKLTAAFSKQKNKLQSYQLKSSLLLNLSLSEIEALEEYQDDFKKFGFDIEHFKDNTYKVTAVPMLFQDYDISNLISEILEDLIQDKPSKEIDKKTDTILSYIACRSAIKAGDKLTKEQCRELLKQLENTKTAYTCPHGRPIKIEIPLLQLHKYFKRV